MSRTAINYLTDVVAFVGFLLLTSTGVVLRFVLPPGSGGQHLGHKAQASLPLELWGWTRHDWGDLHFYIALAFMAVLAFHLVMHWKWILCVTRGKPSNRSGHRLAFGVVGLVGVVLLAFVPLLSPAQRMDQEQFENEHYSVGEGERIRGEMSLEEVAFETGVPVSYILEKLQLPSGIPPTARVGQLKKQFGFTLQDLRQVISEANKQ